MPLSSTARARRNSPVHFDAQSCRRPGRCGWLQLAIRRGRASTHPWMPVGGLRILLSRTVLAGVSRRSLWRPAPAAHALLGSRVAKMSEPKPASGKQASIASFFGGGGQPKRAVTTSAAAGEAGAAKRSADGEAAPSGAQAPVLCCGAARPRRVARNGPLALASRHVFARLVCALPVPLASQPPCRRAASGGLGRHDRSAGRQRAV